MRALSRGLRVRRDSTHFVVVVVVALPSSRDNRRPRPIPRQCGLATRACRSTVYSHLVVTRGWSALSWNGSLCPHDRASRGYLSEDLLHLGLRSPTVQIAKIPSGPEGTDYPGPGWAKHRCSMKRCTKCGNDVTAKFCTSCGTPAPPGVLFSSDFLRKLFSSDMLRQSREGSKSDG